MAIPKRDHKMPTFSTYGDAKVEISGSEKCKFQRESTKCLLLAHVEMKSCVSEGPKLIISKRNLEKPCFATCGVSRGMLSMGGRTLCSPFLALLCRKI